jgi:hypothetical protein
MTLHYKATTVTHTVHLMCLSPTLHPHPVPFLPQKLRHLFIMLYLSPISILSCPPPQVILLGLLTLPVIIT